MPRYEFSEGTSNKFWEIVLEGASFTTTYGKIGADGKSTTKEFDSEAKAQKEYDKAIASKVKKGYVMVGDDSGDAAVSDDVTLDPAAEERFIAALKRDPNDIDTYLAYAAWLQAQGHPRGNLIATQHKRMQDPQNTKLKALEEELLEKHKDVFYGPFAPEDVGHMVDEIDWSMGFISSARVKTTYDTHPNFGSSENAVDLFELFAAFLDHPSAAFIQDLSLGIADFEENNYDELCQIISERQLPTIQSLFIGDFVYEETELNWSEASSAGIYKSLPNLRSLTVRSGSLSFGDIHAPELREFETISGGMGTGAVAQICRAHWPKLERMTLHFGTEGLREVDALQPILDAEGLPNLRCLGICNAFFTDQFIERLATSKLLPQLLELDLKLGTFSDDGVKIIHKHKEAFGHLCAIGVSESYLTDEGIKLLKEVIPYVSAQEQEEAEDPGDRYPSLYE